MPHKCELPKQYKGTRKKKKEKLGGAKNEPFFSTDSRKNEIFAELQT